MGALNLTYLKPRRLASIICLKRIPGLDAKSEQQYSIALKTVSGGKFCSRFVLHGQTSEVGITHGDLAVLCGRKAKHRLLITQGTRTKFLNGYAMITPAG